MLACIIYSYTHTSVHCKTCHLFVYTSTEHILEATHVNFLSETPVCLCLSVCLTVYPEHHVCLSMHQDTSGVISTTSRALWKSEQILSTLGALPLRSFLTTVENSKPSGTKLGAKVSHILRVYCVFSVSHADSRHTVR